MSKIGQNWGKIANYPPNAQQRYAPLHITVLNNQYLQRYTMVWRFCSNRLKRRSASTNICNLKSWSRFIPPMSKIGQNWGKIANYPPNAQQRYAPLHITVLNNQYLQRYTMVWRFCSNRLKRRSASTNICNCNYILFTKLPWPGDSERTSRSSSQAATCPSVYHTRWRLHTVPLIAERQAGKL